jgi:hypothetical protein
MITHAAADKKKRRGIAKIDKRIIKPLLGPEKLKPLLAK